MSTERRLRYPGRRKPPPGEVADDLYAKPLDSVISDRYDDAQSAVGAGAVRSQCVGTGALRSQ